MLKRRIGSLEVSIVGVGCNNFGVRLDAERTRVVVDAAIDQGINFFDTADIYGEIRSEEYLGRALGPRRRSVVVATKFGLPLDERRRGASPAYVRSALEDSLRRLGTDFVDLYQIHRPDPDVPIAETLGALHELVRAGKVREIGCSNFTASQLKESEDAASRAKTPHFVSLQNEYSLLVRDVERRDLPLAEKLGVALLPYFPLASGLLTGKYVAGQAEPTGTRLTTADSRLRDRFLSGPNVRIAEALRVFARSRGHSLLDLAFSWLLARPVVSSVIAGATGAEQIRANAVAGGWELSTADLAAIDQIAPPPMPSTA